MPRLSPLAVAALATLLPAQADCPDQSYLPNPQTNGLEVTANQSVTQTFTVGISGQLTRIEIAQINHHRGTPSQPLQVDLVTCDAAGVPTTTVLASVTLPPASVPNVRGPLQLDLRAFGIPVGAGQVLGIALSSAATPGGQTYAWWGEAPGGSYPRGQVFIRGTTSLAVWDLAFQTWVAQAAGWTGYGAGHPGSNGVPAIGMSANPVLASAPDILVGNAVGATALGAVLFGFGRVSQPTPVGGTALVQPLASVLVTLAAGGGTLPFPIPNTPGLCGVMVNAQAVHFDSGASAGIAFTPGLELTVGV